MAVPSPDYTVDIQTLAGSNVVTDIPVATLTYSQVLNGSGAATFELPIRHPSVTQANMMPAQHQVVIKCAGTPVFGGYLWDADGDLDRQMVTFHAEDWYSRLRKRLITDDLYYRDVDQFNIAWNLIAYTQAISTLGITRASATPSGVTRSRHWCCWQGSSIGEVIADLADADDGFDFQITPGKAWTVWSPQRGAPIDKTFDTADNCYATRLHIDGDDVVTQVQDIPQSEVCDDIQVVDFAASQTTYGLLQEPLNLTHVKVAADRLHMLNEELRIRKRPHTTVQILTPDVPLGATPYDVGDNVKFTSSIGYCTYSAVTFRVMGYEITVKDSAEWARLALDRYHHLA